MSRTPDATHEKYNIDVKDILKDVEVCLKQGLECKISSFFDDYTMFQQTHNEVLNLSIVKKMLHINSSECKHTYDERGKRSETMYHESILLRYETEIETLKNENKNLSVELERYKKCLEFCNDNNEDGDEEYKGEEEEEGELLSQPINLEITEKYSEVQDKDADSNSILELQIEKNIKNIVLNSANKDNVEEEEDDEEDDTEEEEEEDDTEDEAEDEAEDEDEVEEEVKAEVEEEEEVEKEDGDIKEVAAEVEEVEVEEEEVMPTFPTAQELNKLKEIINVVSVEEVEVEADANSVESENDVQAKEEALQAEEEEEEEEELFEVKINDIMYVSNDDEDGTIYSYVDEEVGDEIGKFIGKIAHIYKGANKGVYDKSKCIFNF